MRALIETLRLRCAVRCMLMNQREVIRVGLSVWAEMTDSALLEKASREIQPWCTVPFTNTDDAKQARSNQ